MISPGRCLSPSKPRCPGVTLSSFSLSSAPGTNGGGDGEEEARWSHEALLSASAAEQESEASPH